MILPSCSLRGGVFHCPLHQLLVARSIGGLLLIAVAFGYIAVLVHIGLGAIPAAERLQDAAACRAQEGLPTVGHERQLHCRGLR
jgi:hypothetical protein